MALKTFEPSEAGELACLVVSPERRRAVTANCLLEHLLANARARGIRRLFALSTHTGEWFIERGFQAAAVADLPEVAAVGIPPKPPPIESVCLQLIKPKPFRRPI